MRRPAELDDQDRTYTESDWAVYHAVQVSEQRLAAMVPQRTPDVRPVAHFDQWAVTLVLVLAEVLAFFVFR